MHGLHILGAEQQPAEADDIECKNDSKQAHHGIHILAVSLCPRHYCQPHLMQRESHAVQRTPQHKTHRRTVPQATQNHSDNEVEVCAHLAFAVTAKRDVEVVAQPRRERYMPTTPKLRDGSRLVGRIEVFGEAEAEQKGDTYGHIGISRKIAVNLQRIAVDTHQTLKTRIQRRLVEDAVHEVERYVVRDNGFLYQADDNQTNGRAEHLARNHQRLAYLRNEILGSHDRSCHQLREEREVEDIVNPSLEGLDLSAIDVYGVAHRLEYEERYADGQKYILKIQESRAKQAVGHLDEEVGVLEIAQHSEVDNHAQRHPAFFHLLILLARYGIAYEVVANGGKEEQQEVYSARLVVEVYREGYNVEYAQRCGTAQEQV